VVLEASTVLIDARARDPNGLKAAIVMRVSAYSRNKFAVCRTGDPDEIGGKG
jgi:hypothetical protein